LIKETEVKVNQMEAARDVTKKVAGPIFKDGGY
jgi:hypothetical protein